MLRTGRKALQRVFVASNAKAAAPKAVSPFFLQNLQFEGKYTKPQQQKVTSRSFASLSSVVQETKKPLQDVRKQLWLFYMSTGRGANALFEAIDLDEVRFLQQCYLSMNVCTIIYCLYFSGRVGLFFPTSCYNSIIRLNRMASSSQRN